MVSLLWPRLEREAETHTNELPVLKELTFYSEKTNYKQLIVVSAHETVVNVKLDLTVRITPRGKMT